MRRVDPTIEDISKKGKRRDVVFITLMVLPAVILLAAAVWMLLSAVCPPLLKIITGGRVKPWRRTSGKDLKGSAAAG